MKELTVLKITKLKKRKGPRVEKEAERLSHCFEANT